MPDFVFDAEPYEPPESAAEEGYAKTPHATSDFTTQIVEGSGLRYLGGAVERARNPGASRIDRAVSMALMAMGGARGINPPQPDLGPAMREGLSPYQEGDDQGAYPAAQKLSPDEINKMYAPQGHKITEEPMTASLGALVGKQKTDSLQRQSIIERNSDLRSWPMNFAIGMAAGLFDPLNLAAGMIPGVGEEMIASQLARVGISGVAGRMGARAGAGATVWAAGTVPIAGMKMALSPQEATEFGMRDALYEVFMGAAMGALFHSAGGALRETKIWSPDALMQRDALARARRLSERNAPAEAEPIPGSAETRQAVPESAFGEDRATSLRTAFEGEDATGQPVDLHELGFAKDEIDALHRDGLVAEDGTMSSDQYQAWLDEKAVRAPEELTTKPQETATQTPEVPREEITPPQLEPIEIPPGQPPLPATPGAHADAMRVAMSQVMDGRPVDVTPIAEIAETQQRPRVRTVDEIMATEKDAKGKPVTRKQAERIQEQDILAIARPISMEELGARRAGIRSTPAKVADQIRQQDRDGYATGIPDSELHEAIQEVYGPKLVEEEAPKAAPKAPDEAIDRTPTNTDNSRQTAAKAPPSDLYAADFMLRPGAMGSELGQVRGTWDGAIAELVQTKGRAVVTDLDGQQRTIVGRKNREWVDANGNLVRTVDILNDLKASDLYQRGQFARPGEQAATPTEGPAPNTIERVAQDAGVSTEGKTPDQIADDIADRLPTERVIQEADSQIEAHEALFQEAEREAAAHEAQQAEGATAGAEGAAAGAESEPARADQEPVPAGGGPREPGDEPAERSGPEGAEAGSAETGRGGIVEPVAGGTEPTAAAGPEAPAAGAEPAGTGRAVDSHGNPIFQKGERVVITEGPLAGRHGEVTEANGVVMQSIFGGRREEPFYMYVVRTDGGSEAHGAKLQPETGAAPAHVPDPVFANVAMSPEQLQRSIDYDLSSVQKANGAAARARTQTSKAAHRRAAAEAQRTADQKQAVLDAWKDAHHDEALRIFGEPETPDLTPKAPQTAGRMSLVETNHTKTGAPLFVVSMAERVSPETFNEMKRSAKDNGGYYSSFRGNGAVPGWTFKDRAGAEAFMRAHGGEPPPSAKAAAGLDERGLTVKPEHQQIGVNADGYPLFENDDGVRYYVDGDGFRHTEPVALRPTREGMRPSVPRPEDKPAEFQVAAEAPAAEIVTPGEVTQQAGQESPAPVEPTAEPKAITPAEKAVADAVAPAEGKGPVPVTRPTTPTNRDILKAAQDSGRLEIVKVVLPEKPAGEPPPVTRRAEGEARPSDYGSKNKLVTTDEANAIRERLRAKAKQLRSGVDPELMLDGARLAVYHIEAGTRLFADYAREMISDIGDEFRPYLRSWYEAARHWPGFDSRGMSDHAEVEAEIQRWNRERQPEERGPLTDEDRAEADQILDAHRGDPVMDDIAQQVAEGRAPEDIAETPGVPFSAAEIEGIADALERRGELPEPEEVEGGVQGTVPVRDEGAGAEDVQRTEAVWETERVRPGEVDGGAPTAGADTGAFGEGDGREADNASGTGSRGAGQGNADRVPAARRNARSRAAGRSARPDADVQGENHVIEPGSLEEGRGPKTKARDNVEAIRIVKRLDEEQRLATKAEQDILARYVGWGGLKRVFDEAADDYRDIRSALKELLTDEEYRTAQRSTQYAHYTAENVIRAMWDAARRFGFEGGRVFEPGMGVGHFLGLMPRDVAAKSSYRGVEMDHLTAQIAKALYPQSGVVRADFTQHALPEKAFDLVIGNPPFSDTVVNADPKYRAHGFMLHDYFFAKSLDAVRPGGVLGFVTSAGTMNKLDDAARRYLAERAEFLGGIRLPSSAFRRNAGTEVTTDILFFKRRPEGVVSLAEGEAPDWAQTVVRSLENKEGQVVEGNVSRYFSEHPEMVLGKETFADKLQASDRYAVHPEAGRDLDADLREALDRLPENVMEPEPTPEQRAVLDFSSNERKDGSFYVSDDGKLMQYRDGAGREVPRRGKGQTGGFTAADIERIQHLVPMRDALRDVFSADLARDDASGAEARARLNQQYDAFVEKFGPVNKAEFQYRRPTLVQQETARLEAREEARFVGDPWDDGDFDPSDMLAQRKSISEIAKAREAARQKAAREGRKFNEGTFDPEEMPDEVYERRPNIKPFMSDPESYRLRSIESYNDATGEAAKKRIFTESILKHEEEPEIHSADDGVLWSMNKFGRFDLGKIAERMGRDQSSIVAELGDKVFKVPGTEGTYQTRDEYLSGDVVSKLEEARAAAETDPEVRRNIPALEAAQPPPLAPSQITMTLGMPWIPLNLVKQFLREHLELGEPAVFHSEITGTWHINGERWEHMPGVPKWGTDRRSVFELLSDAMNRTPPKIYDVHREPGGGTSRTFNATATQAAQDAMEKIKTEFQDWARRDTQRAEDLAALYNGRYNRTVLRQYDGSFLTTPGVSVGWGWRPHQTRVISRVIQNGTTYMAHAVGAGKTSAMIGSGMEMRRLGLVKKPMYVVPNHMLGQFTKEFYEQYPTARIAVADEERFHTHTRRQFVANVAQDDLDAVIITHSGFKKIPISDEYMGRMIEDQIGELEAAIEELRDQGAERFTIGRIENQKEKLEQKLRGMASADKDQTLTFEQMGVDFLFVDEAHLFRKLQFVTKQSGLKGISPEGSDMAFDLFAKVRYLDGENPGRAAVFASGTPVTNTMGELYSVQRFMQPRTLEKNGLTHFDSWSQAFGDTKTTLEETAAGTYQPVTRFGQFVNIPELYKMVGEVMDIVTPSELEQYVVRPKLAGGQRQFHLAPRTPLLDAYQAELGQRMEAIKNRKGPPAKGDDILLSVINDGRHAAIDPRFVAETQNDPRSKLNMMIQNAARIWRETEDHQFYNPKDGYETEMMRGPATQMIFANLGVNGRGPMGFSTYQWIKEALRREGVPAEQIAFIGDYKTAIQRQALFNDMNEGKIRILIGSTQKMGTGVNAQRRLVALHNLDPLWFPADDEQRVGRILRQGNLNREIQVHDYSTKGTYDSAMWKMMGNKARFIEQFFRGDPELRNMEDLGEASMYEQASAMSTTDERIITLTELKQELDKARRREDAHDMQQAALKTSVKNHEYNVDFYRKSAERIRKDIARREDTRGDNFTMLVAGEKFDKRAEAADALDAAIKDRAAGLGKNAEAPMGRIGGFPLIIRRDSMDAIRFALRTDDGEIAVQGLNGKGVIASAESALRAFEDRLAGAESAVARNQEAIENIKPLIGQPFTGGGEIIRLAKAVADLEAEIRNKPAGTLAEGADGEAPAPAEGARSTGEASAAPERGQRPGEQAKPDPEIQAAERELQDVQKNLSPEDREELARAVQAQREAEERAAGIDEAGRCLGGRA